MYSYFVNAFAAMFSLHKYFISAIVDNTFSATSRIESIQIEWNRLNRDRSLNNHFKYERCLEHFLIDFFSVKFVCERFPGSQTIDMATITGIGLFRIGKNSRIDKPDDRINLENVFTHRMEQVNNFCLIVEESIFYLIYRCLKHRDYCSLFGVNKLYRLIWMRKTETEIPNNLHTNKEENSCDSIKDWRHQCA